MGLLYTILLLINREVGSNMSGINRLVKSSEVIDSQDPVSRKIGSILRMIFPMRNIETTRMWTQWSKIPTVGLTDQ